MFPYLLIYLITQLANNILQLARGSSAAPGEFQAPTAEEGRVIPVVFGVVKISAPNVVWWGDVRILEVGKQGVHAYSVGMQMALCHGPVDAIVQILAAETKDVPFDPDVVTSGGDEDYIRLYINQTELFGGKKKEGGLGGFIQFYRGIATQQPSAYLAEQLGTTPPAYRGLCHAVLVGEAQDIPNLALDGGLVRGFYVGTSNYPKPLAFVVRRLPDPFGLPALKNPDGQANPAFVIAELLTNPIWGKGTPIEKLDAGNFAAAAETLFDEGFGISFQIDNDTEVDAIVLRILEHIDGALYEDPSTGLYNLKLIRDDYDPETILEITDALSGPPEFGRPSWDSTLNEVKIRYTDSDFREAIAQAQDSANFKTRGELASATFDFPFIRNKELAAKVAMRILKSHCWPLAALRIAVNRKGWPLRIGSPFRFTWNPWGLSGAIFRVTAIDFGSLENGEIEVHAVEDVFAVAHTAFSAPPASEFEEPPIVDLTTAYAVVTRGFLFSRSFVVTGGYNPEGESGI